MTTVRAHFDGHVLIPEGPVDLPQGQTLEVEVREVGELKPLGIRLQNGHPVFDVPADAKSISPEDVRRAMEDE